jgi:hypothetical protein
VTVPGESVLVAIMVVIMIIPIVIGFSAVLIFVPPTVAMIPAIGASLGEFVAPMLSLRTVRPVVLDGLQICGLH